MVVVVVEWGIESPVLETRRLGLSGIRWNKVVIAVGEILVISPTGVVSVWVGVILWALARVLHCVGMFNDLENRLALSSNVALNATNLIKAPTSNITPEEPPTKLLEDGVPSLSNHCARASTLLANKSTASTP